MQLWGFVYTSQYEEMLALSRTEAPGICRWWTIFKYNPNRSFTEWIDILWIS